MLAAEIQETSPYRGAAPREGADIATLFERAVATGKQAGKVWRSRLARLAAAARLASRRRIRRRAAPAIARFGLPRRFGQPHPPPPPRRCCGRRTPPVGRRQAGPPVNRKSD